MNTDKNQTTISVILNASEGSCTPAHNKHKDPSTSLRCGQDDKKHVATSVHQRTE